MYTPTKATASIESMIEEAMCPQDLCMGLYAKGMEVDTIIPPNANTGIDFEYVCSLAQAMRWLREENYVNIDITPIWNYKEWEFQVFIVTPENAASPVILKEIFRTYEQAAEAAIRYTIDNLI